MKSINIKSKIITGVILASLVVCGSTAVFASDSTLSSNNNTSITQNNHKHNKVKDKLDELVSQEKLTSEKAKAVQNVLKRQGASKADKLKIKLDALVKSGTITADEETVIETTLANEKKGFRVVLNNLVKEGKLTVDKVVAIENALKPQGVNKTKINSHKSDFKTVLKKKLDTLVNSGTITSDEETLIINAFTASK